ncbi:GAF domain-containing sensor histidine kinase [bacterium]|nr:GAF domain-containing sensor histidine kinase [bacterium]
MSQTTRHDNEETGAALQKEHLELLLRASQMLSSSLDLQQVLDTLMDQALDVLGAERGLILLRAEESGQWVPRCARSLDVETIVSEGFRFSRGVVDEVMRTCRPVLTSDALEDERFRESASVNLFSLRSVLCVPLKGARQLGVIYLDNSLTRGVFGEQEQSLLEAIAGQAAIAMENAMLYEQLQKVHETSMERARQELAQTQAQLFQSSKMAAIGQLAAGVAHEINNPLGAISLNISTLSKATQDSDALRRLGVVSQATERCRSIVLRLLTFARPQEALEEVVDLAESLASTLELVSGELSRYSILVDNQLVKGAYILGDSTELSQVFLNFIINARDAMAQAEAGQERRLTVRCQPGNPVRVEIEDTGEGMSQEIQQRIFEPFFTTKAVGKGVGLGMSIAYQMLNRHGVKLEIQSKIGQGTRFILLFPPCED